MTAKDGVKILSPKGAIAPTGTWSVGTRAGDFVFVAGMRGIDPVSNTMLAGEEARIRQAFTNMKTIAESEGASLSSCVRLTVYVTDMGMRAAGNDFEPSGTDARPQASSSVSILPSSSRRWASSPCSSTAGR